MEKIRIASVMLCFCLMQALYTGCVDKAPEYPDLEGYWKTERIVDNLTGEDKPCNRLYWALQLQVIELRDLRENATGSLVGRFVYDEGAATLRLTNMVKKGNQSANADAASLEKFGVPSAEAVFEVLSLDGKQMVLRSEKTTLYFRSF